MRRFDYMFSLFIVFGILSGSAGFAQSSTLKMNFINSNGQAPYFPIREVTVRPFKKKGEKHINTEVKFEFIDESGSKKKATIILSRSGTTMEVCPSVKREDRTVSSNAECDPPEKVNPSVRLPKNGPSIIRMTVEPPDIDDKENGGVPNLVITRAAAGKLNDDGSSERNYDDFPQDPTLRLRFRKNGTAFIPSGLSQITHVVDPDTGDYLKTSITTLSRLVVNKRGILTWSPRATVMVSDKNYPSSLWMKGSDGSPIPPGAENSPLKVREKELGGQQGEPTPAAQ